MKTTRILSLLLVGLSGVNLAPTVFAANPKPEPRTEVIFFEPEKFTDVRDSTLGSERGRTDTLEVLKTYLQDRAQIYVPEGAKLSVTITDVDLAGDFEPWRRTSAQDVRIVRDIYPPRINLSFKLTDANGEVVKQGSRELRDLNFMQSISTMANDSYRYEKALLDDWLRSEFQRTKKS
jgi:hypothetical protein